jgi:hypothetical protein
MSQQFSKKEGAGEWWFRLTAPQEPPNPTFTQREATRRGRLASLTIAFISLFATLPLIQGIIDHNPGLLISMVVTLLLNAIALFVLNRRGHLLAAGWLIIVVFDLGFALSLLASPGGTSYTNIRGFDVMAVAVLIVVAFFPPRSVFIIAPINAAFMLLWMFFGPHDQQVAEALQQNAYGLLFPPMALEIYIAGMAFLWVSSAVKAIANLDRTEEIVALERKEIAQQEQQLLLKKQLEEGVDMLLETHVRAANGDFKARAPLSKDNILWKVAYSLNNLLSRLERYNHSEAEVAKTHAAIHKLAEQIHLSKQTGQPVQLQRTGTPVDEIMVALYSTNVSRLEQPNPDQSSLQQQPFKNPKNKFFREKSSREAPFLRDETLQL